MAAVETPVKAPPALKPAYRKSIKRNGDAAAPAEPEASDDQQAEELKRATIETTIAEYIREAIQARETSGIEEVWQDSEDLYNGVDHLSNPGSLVKTRDQQPVAQAPDSRSKILLNITKPKTDIGVARVQEMLVPHDEKPWEVGPTPVPEFDIAEIPEASMLTLGDGTQAPAQLVAQVMLDKATTYGKNMTTWIEDRFIEGKVYSEMRQVIKDAGRIGTGVLKGPFPTARTDRKWSVKGGIATLEKRVRIEPTSKKVRAQDCFPDPACGQNIHDGSYFVERDHITIRKLRQLADDPDYDRARVAQALQEGPQRGVKGRNDRTTKLTPGETAHEAKLFELFYVYCDVPPADLLAMGLADELDETELQLTHMPAVVTMLNGRCIKCVINPNETGEFPFDFFVWDQIDGQPWGRGIPYKMAVAQKGCTAAIRALMENAGVSSGPQIAITDTLVPINGVYEVVGRKLWRFKPTELIKDIRAAMASFDIPSMQQELLAIIQFFLNMADQLTNLPMLLQGEQAAGTSPETLGGMKLLVQNASSPLRVIAKQYDDGLIIPHLTRWHDWGMQHGPDNIKGDLQVKAKGSTVLVQREEAREFLMSLFAVKDDPSLRIDPVKYASEMARANGFNMATIQFTEEEWKKHVAQMPPPPKDPRIEAAEIRNQGIKLKAEADAADAAAERDWKAGQAAAEAQVKKLLAAVDKDIEMMRLSGQQNISLDNVKAMLAGKAMDNALKRDEMQLKLAPQNQTHEGI
jgi:hypothetical protein